MMRIKLSSSITCFFLFCLISNPAFPSAGITTSAPKSSTGRQVLALIMHGTTSSGCEGDTLWLKSIPSGKSYQLLSDYIVHEFTFSQDGKRIIFLAAIPGDDNGSLELWQLDLASKAVTKITTNLWGEAPVTWVPGKDQVTVSRTFQYKDPKLPDSDGGLWIIDLKTGKLKRLIAPADADNPMATKSVFNADGSMIAVIRGGFYCAIFQTNAPDKWFRLDKPSYMNPHFISDMAWIGSSRKLLISATSTKQNVSLNAEQHMIKGPGGIWKWNLQNKNTVTGPIDTISTTSKLPSGKSETSAEPLSAIGESIYAISLDHRNQLVAYLSDSGLWLYDLAIHSKSHLLDAKSFPEIKALRQIDIEYRQGGDLATLLWSPDNRYLSLASQDALRVIDIKTRKFIYSYTEFVQSRCMAWQPASN